MGNYINQLCGGALSHEEITQHFSTHNCENNQLLEGWIFALKYDKETVQKIKEF